jgi:NTE family protein
VAEVVDGAAGGPGPRGGGVVTSSTGLPAADPVGSRPIKQPVDLVLNGGGVKGMALVGALSVLESRFEFQRVAGTSAGAIVGSLVAAGMTGSDLHDLMLSLNYERFRDKTGLDKVPLVGEALSLWFREGIYAGSYARTWLATELANLKVHTFADLRQDDPASSLAPENRFKLVVVTSDVTRGRIVHLPWDYAQYGIDADRQRVSDAVRASMSIPFYFRPERLAVPGAAPSVLVDGGMLSNFPVDIFDRTDGRPPRWPTLGIKLSLRQPPDAIEYTVKGDISLAEAMLGTMQGWNDAAHLDDPSVLARTVFVDTFSVNATDFSIDPATQQRLFESGQQAAQHYLDRHPAPSSA